MRLSALAFIGFSCIGYAQSTTGVLRYGFTSETILRRWALDKVRPQYPADAVSKGVTGVAVAEVVLGSDGSVEYAAILEAPSQSIGRAVLDAVRKWRFAVVPFAETNS
jgi:TonB family protein